MKNCRVSRDYSCKDRKVIRLSQRLGYNARPLANAEPQWLARLYAAADYYGEYAMDALERIQDLVSKNPVIIFMKGSPDFPQCGFSARTVQALNTCGREYAYVNIYEDQEVYQALPQFANWPTFPQLYLKGELVGGCDITLDLHASGELQKMVDEAAGVPA